jgi:hypothetical protein
VKQPRVPAGQPTGGQWVAARSGSAGSSAGQSSKGDWSADPLAGEKHGTHTPAAMKRVMTYLERETGENFVPHGSVSRGETSMNDFDIAMLPTSQEEMEQQYHQSNVEMSRTLERAAKGELTHEQAMVEIYGNDPMGNSDSPLDDAMTKIGFRRTREMGFVENYVERFHRPSSGHTIEIWSQREDGDAESGPSRMFGRDL